MTEAEWLNGTDPNPAPMFEFLRTERGMARTKSGRRKLRLFACACVRGIWPLLRRPASREAVETAERVADGLENARQLYLAYSAAGDAIGNESRQLGKSPFWHSAEAARHVAANCFDRGDHPSVAHAAYTSASAWTIDKVGTDRTKRGAQTRFRNTLRARWAVHADWLRDIVPNPFLPPLRIPRWRTKDLIELAQTAYEKRHLPSGHLDADRLAVLADAVEEAGCQEAVVLDHLRSPGPHLRGCWAVDLLLGKH